MSNELKCTYDVGGEKVELSPGVVRSYLVSGEGKPSDAEVVFFMKMCKARGLNPWIKEAYLIKYSNNSPASLVVGKDYFLRKAQQNKNYEGHSVEIDDTGETATATVHVKGLKVPIVHTVYFDEAVGKKSDGTTNKQWSKSPKAMLKKCALVGALREAFTSDFGQMYLADEVAGAEVINEADVVEPQELYPQPETSKPPKAGKKANESDKGWQQSCESFRDTIGEDGFNDVLKGAGFDCWQKVQPKDRQKVFTALGKKASECL